MSNTPQEVKNAPKFADRLVVFIQKRRTVLITIVAVVFIGIAVTGGVYLFIESSAKKASSVVESLASRYDEIRA
ncbi:MAG: hypothetical protein WCT14_21465, partial [Treponemataceae bacterium]